MFDLRNVFLTPQESGIGSKRHRKDILNPFRGGMNDRISDK